MVMMVMEPQAVGNVRTGRESDHAASNKAHRAGHDGTRSRTERSVDDTFSGAGGRRRQQRQSHECYCNNLSHNFPT